jgi:hypothetical protein
MCATGAIDTSAAASIADSLFAANCCHDRGYSMTLASIDAGGDFRVGYVLNRAWSIFTRNIIFFLAVPLLINGLSFGINFALGSLFAGLRAGAIVAITPGRASLAWAIFGAAIVSVVLFLGVHMIGQGVLLTGAFQRLRGEPLRVGVALQRALARFLPLVALSILITLVMIAVVIGCSVVLWTLTFVLGRLVVVLMIAILVPIFILSVMWSVVVPACLVEGLGPIASMARSADLTKGYRWKVVGIMLLLGLIVLSALIIMIALARLSPIAVLVFEVAGLVLWSGYFNCAIIMIYHDLRVAKEGVDTAQIASVFD